MLRHWVVLFSSPAIFVLAIPASSLSLWWFMLLSTQKKKDSKAFQELSSNFCTLLCRVRRCRVMDNEHPFHTFHLAAVYSSKSNILDDLDWQNTNSAVRSETSSLGLLVIIFFTLLAWTHGRSSVSKTPLCCDQCLGIVREEAKHERKWRSRSEAPSFLGKLALWGAFSLSHMWNNWHIV